MFSSKSLQTILQHLISQFRNRTFSLIFINTVLIIFQIGYVYFRYDFLNSEISLWFTRLWGDAWLAPKIDIYIIPATSVVIFLMGLLLILVNRFYVKYIYSLIWGFVIFCNLFLSYSLVNIIRNVSTPFPPFLNPLYVPLVVPFFLSFLAIYIVLPYFIDYAQSKRLITNPRVHDHPAMILKLPSARGGGFVFSLVFLAISILYIGISRNFFGLYISILMIAILGIMDDFQNTHPLSSFHFLENPGLRLFLLFMAVLPTVFSGIVVDYISNPFGPIIDLAKIHSLLPLVFTTVWIVWVMNVLSWSNGVDGQYSGVVGIASLAIAFLALRFKPLDSISYQVAMLASISAGASFGLTKYNWHPSKIMWGFGAMSAGLILSVLSISIRGKIVTSVLIILIPFLDALVTVIRRTLQGKNPLSGDRGHLHHILLDRGWSVNKIARFYWFTAAIFGLLGVLLPDTYSVQVTMIVTGLVAFVIVLLNLKSSKDRHLPPESVKEVPKEAVL